MFSSIKLKDFCRNNESIAMALSFDAVVTLGLLRDMLSIFKKLKLENFVDKGCTSHYLNFYEQISETRVPADLIKGLYENDRSLQWLVKNRIPETITKLRYGRIHDF